MAEQLRYFASITAALGNDRGEDVLKIPGTVVGECIQPIATAAVAKPIYSYRPASVPKRAAGSYRANGHYQRF